MEGTRKRGGTWKRWTNELDVMVAKNGLMKLNRIWRYGNKILAGSGQRPEGTEEDYIASQGPQRFVVLEEVEQERRRRRRMLTA
jgi:hypothetical protein